MEKYDFYCNCYLKHCILINELFIGKRIPIKVHNKYQGYLLFPNLKKDNNAFELISPYVDEMICQERCGKVDIVTLPSNKQILQPEINCISFCIATGHGCNREQVDISKIINELEDYVNKFIKCISLIKKTAIQWSYNEEDGYIKPIDFYHTKNAVQNKWKGIINMSIVFNNRINELSINDFWEIYRGLSKKITLQYELLSDVYRCLKRNEYREAILLCATIIEKTLKTQIIEYLDKEHTAEKIKNYILSATDGFVKILNIMVKFGLQTDNCNLIKAGTINIRNRIIHGGYFPSKTEAEKAMNDAELIIKQYKIPLFVN